MKVSVRPALVAWALLEFQFRGLSRDDAGQLDAPHKADGEQIRKKWRNVERSEKIMEVPQNQRFGFLDQPLAW